MSKFFPVSAELTTGGGGVVSKFFPVRAVRAELATGGGGGGRGIEQSITNLRKDDIMVEIAYGPGLCMTI